MARPSTYTDEIGSKILELLSEGLSIVKIGKRPDMPSRPTIMRWLEAGNTAAPDSFRDSYATARQQQADKYFTEIIDLADDLIDDPNLSSEQIAAAKLRVDSRKWVIARMNRAKYGDHSSHELTGQGGAEIRFSWKPDNQDAKED